jgi:type I restriction enzyme, S subunit
VNRDEGQLPSGWVEATIGDLVGQEGVFCDGDWVETKDQDPAGDVRLIQLADVGDGRYRDKSNRFLTSAKAAQLNCSFLRSGDLLVARMPDPLGRACIFPGDRKKSVTVVDVCLVRLASPVRTRWLMHHLNAPQMRQRVAALQSGSTRKRISRTNFGRIHFPLPPVPEQERIADALDELFSDLDAGVAALERAREKLNLYRASVLKAAVEGALTADWRKQHPHIEPASELLKRILAERRRRWEEDQLANFKAKNLEPPKNWKAKYREPSAPDSANLPSLPDEWSWATVEQVASGHARSIQSGPFGSQLLHSEFSHEGYLAIGIDNVLDGKFSLGSEHRITQETFDRLRKFEARPRDVVVTVMATVGRVCVLPPELESSIITKHCYRITADDRIADPEFLAIALRAESPTRLHIYGNIRGQTRPGINGPILKLAPVALPPPTEQEAIVEAVEDQLSIIDHIEADLDAKLKSAQGLRQAILRHAFTGQLVPQDPKDEPASELLKRIATEREARRGEVATAKRAAKKTNSARRGRPVKQKEEIR